MRLYDLKHNLHAASGGLWIVEGSRTEDEIKEALGRGDAIVIEVAAVTEAITVHTLAVDDLDGFGSLSAWSAFQCSGRETPFDSIFFRVDVEPVEQSREFLREGVTPQPSLSTGNKAKPAPSLVDDDDDEAGDLGGGGGPGGGPERGRKPGDEEGPAAAPVPVRPRPPRSR